MKNVVLNGSRRQYLIAAASGVLGLTALAAILWSAAEAASQVVLTGTVTQNCAINVTADPAAATLDLVTSGARRVQVGTVSQNCNKKAGYNLVVTSTNCATTPTGAKLIGSSVGEKLNYSVESNNPTTGGSTAVVTGLLASSCTGQNARQVSNAKISAENSTLFVNFTGNSSLSADTYQDTVTLTMNVN